MDFILSLFDFNASSFGTLALRMLTEAIIMLIVVYLVALVILSFTKNKSHKVNFSSWFKICVMYGIDAAIAALGVIVIFTLVHNTLFAFTSFSWSWSCGYILMIPEFLLFAGAISSYWVLRHQIFQSIK